MEQNVLVYRRAQPRPLRACSSPSWLGPHLRKLRLGTLVPRPASPVTRKRAPERVSDGHGGDASNDIDCRGRRPRAQSRWTRCYRSREEREEKPLSPPPPRDRRSLSYSRNIGLSRPDHSPLVVVPMGVVCFCVSRALALF